MHSAAPAMSRDAATRRIVRYVSGGFLSRRIRRIAWLAGYDLRPGLPRAGEAVAAWGRTAVAARAEAVAHRAGVPLLRFEDPFLRSLHVGRAAWAEREPPLGLLIDARGCHFDPTQPSDLEHLLAHDPFDDGAVIAAARAGIDAFVRAGVTKYAATLTDPVPDPGYVLVVDQTRGDAAIRHGGATDATFREMLLIAREENPGLPIVIKAHPETAAGRRPGHYDAGDAVQGAVLIDAPLSPALLFEGAVRVYTVSSQLGFEAILHGHRPVVFGQPFYAGWGLTDDRAPAGSAIDRRTRRLTKAQLFAGAMVIYPHWYDPHRDALCGPLEVIRHLEARARAWREDRDGWSAPGIRLWKRGPLRRFLSGRVTYRADPSRRALVWGVTDAVDGDDVASGDAADPLVAVPGRAETGAAPSVWRIEDGFLRSRGLGAELVPPLSLVLDGQGIYYDPTARSDLEDAVMRAAALPPEALVRAAALREAIVAAGLSKYNLDGDLPDSPDLPDAYVLVPGQVADDASIRRGATGPVADNAALLRAARDAHPGAAIVYKPHPDVEAGLRDGAIDASDADVTATRSPIIPLIRKARRVCTITSLAGFEALLHDVPVTTYGAPFYAGWGLTRDLGPVPARRRAARPSRDALVHAALIAAPRYVDPVTGTACAPEVAVERLARGPRSRAGPATRLLSKAQGALASQTRFWR